MGHKYENEFAVIRYDSFCLSLLFHMCAHVRMHADTQTHRHMKTDTHRHAVCHNSVQLVIFSSPEAQNSREIVQSGLMWRTSVCTHSSLSFWKKTIKRGLKKECQREESQHIYLFFLIYLLLIYRCRSTMV